ncbi:hypothetical protein ACEWY4_001061 [Coilia grayii]|uniref:CG-1 domain-containing protein n=1 Tax=Coilia grayii TaxID=363190 RepID=A0ABD1KZR7_9TELE
MGAGFGADLGQCDPSGSPLLVSDEAAQDDQTANLWAKLMICSLPQSLPLSLLYSSLYSSLCPSLYLYLCLYSSLYLCLYSSLCPSLCPSLYLYLCLYSISAPVSTSILCLYSSLYLCLYPSLCPSLYPSLYLCLYPSLCPSLYLYLCLYSSLCPSLYPSLYLCLYPSLCPSLSSISASTPNGSMILYNRKKVKYRKDGYCWKKRKDGKTTREDHMKLKVQGVEVGAVRTERQVFWADPDSSAH